MFKVIFFGAIFLYLFAATESKVCRRDIVLSPYNSTEQFKMAAECTSIEGMLMLMLLDGNEFSLPQLTMVTDYVIIHRINGMLSLANLLPELRVIRGRKFHKGFALVVLSNDNVERIGPWHLEILHGSVVFEDNIMLCTGGPSLWRKKTNATFHNGNKFVNNHPYCWMDDIVEAEQSEAECQRKRDCRKEACLDGCVDGCSSDTNTTFKCHNCRNFNKNGACLPTCPKNYLQYMDYLCVTPAKCRFSMKMFVFAQTDDEPISQCVPVCPRGFEEDTHKTCVEQEERTRCDTTTITSVNMGEKLKHCKTIHGSLRIVLHERASITKIWENTKHIVTVTGYIEVVGSSLLYSLANILPNLRYINGQELIKYGDRRYALYVTDNVNLKELWKFDSWTDKMIIRGKIYVGFNSMLCPAQVELLSRSIDLSGAVHKGSNGLKAQCDITKTILVAKPGSTEGTVHLHFNHTYGGNDARWTLGYFIYYRQAETDVASIFEGRDPYHDENVWTRVIWRFVDKVANALQFVYSVRNLKVSARYAFYVESFASGQETKAVESDVVYASTLGRNPTALVKDNIDVFEGENAVSFTVVNDVESIPSDKFYIYTIHIPFNEDRLNLNKTEFLYVVKDRSKLPVAPSGANDSFTNMSDMEEIICDGRVVNIQLYSEYKDRKIKVTNAIINTFYIFNSDADISYLSATTNDSTLSTTTQKPPEVHTDFSINWSDNNISFTETPDSDVGWSETDSTWHTTRVTTSNVLYLDLPSNHISYADLDREITVQECRNVKDNCSLYLGVNSSCAQCSLPFTWIDKYEDRKDFNVTAEIFSVTAKIYSANETVNDTLDIDHPCANRIEDRDDTLVVRWPHDRMALGYNISVTRIMGTSTDIWVNQHTADELNYTCYLPINSTYISISVSSERALRSIVLGSDNVRLPDPPSNNMMHIVGWSGAFLLVVLGIGITIMWRTKNKNKQEVFNNNPNYRCSMVPPEKNPNSKGVHEFTLKGPLQKFEIEQHRVTISKDPPIGKGNSAFVLKGEFNNKLVAIKQIIVKEKHTLDQVNRNTVKEFQINNQLKSDLITKCHGILIKEQSNCQNMELNTFWLVFEYIAGGNLADFLPENKDITSTVKQRFAIQVAKALDYLMSKYIVHCDIASRNILINAHSNNIKLCDFGLAAVLKNGCPHKVSNGNLELPVNCAPELCSKIRTIYPTTDIWSCGFVIYEIYMGEPMFKDIDKNRVREIITNLYDTENPSEVIDNPFERIDNLPQVQRDIVRECLRTHKDRPASAKWINDRLTGTNWLCGQFSSSTWRLWKSTLSCPSRSYSTGRRTSANQNKILADDNSVL